MENIQRFYCAAGKEGDTIKKRLSTHLHAMIQGGELAPGFQLPSTSKLAALWKVDVGTIHYALKGLVQDGLIERVNGRGTFVREQASELKTVGLYVESEGLLTAQHTFKSQLTHDIRMVLRERGLEGITILDTRPGDQRQEVWPELLELARSGRIQGVVHLCGGTEGAVLQRLLSVPIASTSIEPCPPWKSELAIVEMALRQLVKSGCRRIGLIEERHQKPMQQKLVGLARELGIDWRTEWCLHPGQFGTKTNTTEEAENFGYHAFHHLWQLDDRPDGLVVYYDHPSRGVLMAIGETGCRVPGDLKLVLHRNEGLNYLCPFPVDIVEFRLSILAEQYIDKLEADLAGRSCPQPNPISPHHLVSTHANTPLVLQT